MDGASFNVSARRALWAGVIGLVLGLGARKLSAQQGLLFPSLPTATPVGTGQVQPCLAEAQGETLCGRFRVFENRQAMSGRTIDLAFVVLKSLNGPASPDAFTFIRGGPGGPVTPGAVGTARGFAAIRAERDIVLLDHRGTGNSEAIPCDEPFPGGVESRFETVFPLDHVVACRDRLSGTVDLSQYTTPHVADDLADLTTWLGYEQLNLYGSSYGTREVQVFTRRHPEMVRTVVLNGVAPVDSPVYLYHAQWLQTALENLIAECQSQTLCHNAYPDLEAVVDEVLATATNAPPVITAEGRAIRFGVGPLSYALRGLLYGQAGTVPARIHEAYAGNWQPLADLYLARQAWVGAAGGAPAGYHYSVLCSEDIDPLTWDQIATESEGTFMGDFLIAGYKRACQEWPSAIPAPDHRTAVRSTAPALLLSGSRDPVTPPSGADEVATGWPNSVHITVPNGGHVQGGPCVSSMVLQLVQSGSVQGLDATCIQSAPPTTFELPSKLLSHFRRPFDALVDCAQRMSTAF